MNKNIDKLSLERFSIRLNNAMPRRRFLSKFIVISIGIAITRSIFSDMARAGGTNYGPCGSGVSIPNPCNYNPNCGNAGYIPSSTYDPTAPGCCNCSLANGCPIGMGASSGWSACCSCDSNSYASGQIGMEVIYYDCCVPGGGNPGSSSCPPKCFLAAAGGGTAPWTCINPACKPPTQCKGQHGSTGDNGNRSWCPGGSLAFGTISSPTNNCCIIS